MFQAARMSGERTEGDDAEFAPPGPGRGLASRIAAARKVAVFRALKLGDMLCAVPALRALRAGLPDSEIVLVGLPWAREFAARFTAHIDGFREFPGHPGLPERTPAPGEIERFFGRMEGEGFDLALQMHGSGVVSNGVTAGFGAGLVAGFLAPGHPPPGPGLFVDYPSRGLESRRLLALVEAMGIPSRGDHLEFPISEEERGRAATLLADRGLAGRPFACVHPGASVPERRWPSDRFAAVADALAERGLAVVLTGSADEAWLTREVMGRMKSPAVDLAGATPIGELGAVIAASRILVCNDTGVSHVADGLRAPSVVISTGDNPARWAPVDRGLHRVLCRESGVAVEDVVAEAARLLARDDI
ncbi:glycosyltransferase family 9 protein [Paludisphaera sp.]|uniref:glycosyltransferase family 9 protein n=1 Tax=Paludisphaera sp. TaxID=2017432 RepID=UPI00301BA878